MIYFDNAATTYPKPQCVYDAISEAMQKFSFNAGRGGYIAAQETYKMIQDTRGKIADFINSSSDKVIFTSSATESLNIILHGIGLKKGDNVFVSPFEHNAIIRTLHILKVKINIIPFNNETWDVDFNKLNDMVLLEQPKAVVISHISNVTGFELPYEKIFEVSKKYNCITVLDSAQGFGIYSINTKNCDFVVFAGHKSLYAMLGIAGFININSFDLAIFKTGGTGSDSLNLDMPENGNARYEAGTLNSVAIYSLFRSIDFLKNSNFDIIKHDLTKYFLNSLRNLSNIKIYLPPNYISSGIVSLNVLGYTSDEVGTILDANYNICVRTGYHCAPFIHDFLDIRKYNGCVRISFSGFNSKQEIDVLIDALKEM